MKNETAQFFKQYAEMTRKAHDLGVIGTDFWDPKSFHISDEKLESLSKMVNRPIGEVEIYGESWIGFEVDGLIFFT